MSQFNYAFEHNLYETVEVLIIFKPELLAHVWKYIDEIEMLRRILAVLYDNHPEMINVELLNNMPYYYYNYEKLTC